VARISGGGSSAGPQFPMRRVSCTGT
jgi:hypothetical protein